MDAGDIDRELTGIRENAVVLKGWCLIPCVWNKRKKVDIYNKWGEPKREKLIGAESTWSMREI